MRRLRALILAVPVLFLGCGDKSDGGLNRTNNYETYALDVAKIEGSYTVEADDGLNFSVIPAVDVSISASFYAQEGNLSDRYVEVYADDDEHCSDDSYTKDCVFDNNESGETYTFTIENRANSSLRFKVVAYQGSLSEGSTGDPIGINVGSWVSGQVGFTPSYYDFTKSGLGKVAIDLKAIDTMSDLAEDLNWTLTRVDTGVDIEVTDADGNTSTTCRDDYRDENISCTTYYNLLDDTTYRLKVENAGETALVEYKILITPR